MRIVGAVGVMLELNHSRRSHRTVRVVIFKFQLTGVGLSIIVPFLQAKSYRIDSLDLGPNNANTGIRTGEAHSK